MTLLENILYFQKNLNNFINILYFFESKIKFLDRKLNYPEAKTDLIIFLYQLCLKIDLTKFKNDSEILRYIKRSLDNKSTKLYYAENNYKSKIVLEDDYNILDSLNPEIYNTSYSDIYFYDLISILNRKQKRIIYYKFYLQLSDSEIAESLNISRQAVNKIKRKALSIIKNILEDIVC